MKINALILAFAVGLSVVIAPQSNAATSLLSMSIKQTPSATDTLLTLYGNLKPNRSGTTIKVEVNLDGKWSSTEFATRVTTVGTWRVRAIAPANDTKLRYRVVAIVSGLSLYSPIRTIDIKKTPAIIDSDPAKFIDLIGPGGRIHGSDISRWQHPNEKAIDFVKMYNAGMRFVFIKASDTRESADQLALKYAVMDHNAAQAAGIYTGFYHYALLPNVRDPEAIREDALAQAQKVAWRLAAMGGYGPMDLPYALDLENKCVQYSSSGDCLKYATRAAVTLWATVFLASLKEKTQRTPILYSYPMFLEGSMIRTEELVQYPLWLANYSINPVNPSNQPGMKKIGCYVHSWTSANCDSGWTVWQYSSCGIASKYGVPSNRLDLNVFRGSPTSFLDLVKGIWSPAPVDLMPKNESSTITLLEQSWRKAEKAVRFKIAVDRPSGAPVVTGDVKLIFDKESDPSLKPIQSAVRETSGVWTLELRGMPAGEFSGKILYQDVSGTHAKISVPVLFIVEEGTILTPKPTPSKKQNSDGCRGQIKN